MFRREYRSTYRDSVVASERVVQGKWWRPGDHGAGRISIEQDVARELGVGLGDEIVWDVQGIPVTSKVASVREVDWARFEPNFFVVFAPGTLEDAPQYLVTLTRVASAAERGSFQRRLAERFPNVSTLDLSMLQEALERLVDRVALAIRFMALFSLMVGALVLVGALASSRFQRMRGRLAPHPGRHARAGVPRRARRISVTWPARLGRGGRARGCRRLGASPVSCSTARFSLPVLPMSALAAAIVALTVVVGLGNSRDVVRRAPLEVLREE